MGLGRVLERGRGVAGPVPDERRSRRSHVQLARKLEHLPVVAEAFGLGEISRSHAAVIAEAYTPERAAEISNVEPQLVAAAHDHTPSELGGLVRFVTDAIDGDGGAESDEAQHARRGYFMSSTSTAP